jgi:HTH-type transcriptional regulator/antitoxin HigA
MITNDRQYKITKNQIEEFESALNSISSIDISINDIHPRIVEFQKEAIQVKLKELTQEVFEYDELKSGKIAIAEITDLKELPLTLIKARIANRLTQSDLAERVGVKMQQIQKYESEKYESASVKTLLKIAEALEIRINGDVQIKHIDNGIDFDLKKYPFKQMYQRGWFKNFYGNYNEAVLNSENLIAKLYENVGSKSAQYSFNKKTIKSNSKDNPIALSAWYARVIDMAKEQHLDSVFNKDLLNDEWLNNLVRLSVNKTGVLDAVNFIKESGIKFIVEQQLEGTYLDGAAILMDKIQPIIAMTLRYDRLDNFWFVLLHEIAHIKLHLSDEIESIFDDLDIKLEGIESEADAFALNAIIPDLIWKKSLVRFSPSKETIINQAKTLKINPALIAGRLRRETGKYTLFNDLIGRGEVRINFINEIRNT